MTVSPASLPEIRAELAALMEAREVALQRLREATLDDPAVNALYDGALAAWRAVEVSAGRALPGLLAALADAEAARDTAIRLRDAKEEARQEAFKHASIAEDIALKADADRAGAEAARVGAVDEAERLRGALERLAGAEAFAGVALDVRASRPEALAAELAERRKFADAALSARVSPAGVILTPEPRGEACGCRTNCGDDGNIDGPGTCKGLPPLSRPLVEVVVVHRDAVLRPGGATPQPPEDET